MSVTVVLLGAFMFPSSIPAQQNVPNAPTPQNDVPDAPSASKPVLTMPNSTAPTRPAPSSNPPSANPASSKPPASNSPSGNQADPPASENAGTPAAAADQQQPAPPQPQVRTVPQGGETQMKGSERDQLFTLVKPVNFVLVPVTVKDTSGRPIYGLLRENFSIFEDGNKQNVRFFTSDPFPISAAVVVDAGMADVALRRVQDTVASLGGAFSEFDELAVYTYGNTVKQQQDFAAALSDKSTATLRKLKQVEGRTGGVAVNSGPMVSGPTINGRPADPGTYRTATSSTRNMEPSRVLNDAILRAAIDLSKRDRTRRKIIFVISEGREDGSVASYSDVLKVLLSNEVTLYAVAVDSAAIPGYGTLSKIRLPRQGYGNILPKYASATGGDVITEFSKDAIERAYARITEQARNQYTLGYNTGATPSSAYRSIEVRVDRSGLKVFARDGYYPLPPPRK
ncbi:MAG TPA: VWA domain-containing protein [Clostridia bacterium]|nr:VWA domain-containing protein [Clostridia bacterium]